YLSALRIPSFAGMGAGASLSHGAAGDPDRRRQRLGSRTADMAVQPRVAKERPGRQRPYRLPRLPHEHAAALLPHAAALRELVARLRADGPLLLLYLRH